MALNMDRFVKIMDGIAPERLALSWDNGGLILKSSGRVSRVLVTVDVTTEVISEAVEKGADMIVAHHPILFNAVKKMSIDDENSRLAVACIKNGISVYAAHTSADTGRAA